MSKVPAANRSAGPVSSSPNSASIPNPLSSSGSSYEFEKPLLSGWLLKQGAKGPLRGWKKRWFQVLKNSSTIDYFKNPKDPEPLGSVDMTTIQAIEPCVNNLGLRKEKGEFAFQFSTPTRIYFLQANGESIMDYWLNGVRNLVSSIQDGGSSATYDKVPSDLKDQLENLSDGQLYVEILSAEGLPVSKATGQTGVYCVLTFDKQQTRTQSISDFAKLLFNEDFRFDATKDDFRKKRVLVISVWAQDMSRSGGSFIGQIVVPIDSLIHEKPIDQHFNLRPNDNSSSSDFSDGRARGKIHVKLIFSSTKEMKVGLEDFDQLRLIGKGNFGKVIQVRKKDTGRIYAMKILRKDTVIAADAVQHTLSESNVLRRINHPFVVNLKFSFQTEDRLFMVMDYLSGGELFYHLSAVDRFDEERAKFYAAEIILALGYLHENGIVYRDLKPENLLLDISGHICLTDFGLVKEGLHFGDVTHTFCGSPEYLAPEILQGKGYGKEVDWWALGTFLYEMLDGLPPFYDEDVPEMNRRILCAPLYFSEHFSPEAKSLLRGLLQRNSMLRIGSGKADFRELMSQPFFKGIDWDKLLRKEIEPAFKPHLQNPEDVRYFDPEFTTQTVKESFVDKSKLPDGKQNLFSGFSFVSTSSFEQMMKQRRRLNSDARNRPMVTEPPALNSSPLVPPSTTSPSMQPTFNLSEADTSEQPVSFLTQALKGKK